MTKTIFEKSQQGQKAYSLPKNPHAFTTWMPPTHLLRQQELVLPEVSELDLTRHFSNLAHSNMSIDTNFYPLGSCTMKFNPRINEYCAQLPGFTRTHPLAPEESVQGNLEIIYEFTQLLCDLCGMSAGSLLPNAGAQSEFVGIQMIAAYHTSQGNTHKNEILVPDNAHGTNPASAAMAGFKTLVIPSNGQGDIDLDRLKELVTEKTAALMLTNPNTLGLFSSKIKEIAALIHHQGGLLYYDGANLNPILHVVRPGEMGFDVMHLNLHKTFSTPHGGGGPGSGPILCSKRLQPFLPSPQVKKQGSRYHLEWENAKSIGSIATFHGNFAIYLRAYMYAMLHGSFGLRRIAENAVLNANYLKIKLGRSFKIPFQQYCMHEFVLQLDNYLDKGIRALDIAKRLLDYNIHSPTVYFPLIIKECMLIEPTESESKATLDAFIAVMEKIIIEIQEQPDIIQTAPHTTPVSRLDEVCAVKQPKYMESLSLNNCFEC